MKAKDVYRKMLKYNIKFRRAMEMNSGSVTPIPKTYTLNELELLGVTLNNLESRSITLNMLESGVIL